MRIKKEQNLIDLSMLVVVKHWNLLFSFRIIIKEIMQPGDYLRENHTDDSVNANVNVQSDLACAAHK